MDELLQCSVCYSEYDTESHKPCMGKCGHSICFICANNENCRACPICRKAGSFQEIVVSFVLMNIIEYKNNKKKEIEGICSLCKKEATELAICIDCSIKDGIIRRDDSESENDEDVRVKWNTESLSLEECIQQARLSSYCGNCSIGGVHNGHRASSFKMMQQTIFSKEISGIKEEIEKFSNFFVNQKEEVNQKLEEYRQNIFSLLNYVAQLSFDQFTNYPTRVMEFIEKSKDLSKGLTSCHQDITNSIKNIEKKLMEANGQSNPSIDNEAIIYHLKYSLIGANLEIYAYNTIKREMKLQAEISREPGSCAIVHKNNVFIIGGHNGAISKQYLKTVEVYNLNDSTRKKLTDLHEARSNPSVCMNNGKIFVYGGRNPYLVNTLEEYDIKKNTWKNLGQQNIRSIGYRFLSAYNNMFVGKVDSSTLAINRFIEEERVFENVHEFELKLLYHHATYFDGKIFIIGQHCVLERVFKFCLYVPSRNEVIPERDFLTEKEFDVKFYVFNKRLYAIDSNSVEMYASWDYKWTLEWSKQME